MFKKGDRVVVSATGEELFPFLRGRGIGEVVDYSTERQYCTVQFGEALEQVSNVYLRLAEEFELTEEEIAMLFPDDEPKKPQWWIAAAVVGAAASYALGRLVSKRRR